MKTGQSCTARVLHHDGEPVETRPHRGRGRCGDCGVAPGGAHHLGCDMQRCPTCSDQLISCGCPFDELPRFDDEDDDWDDDWTADGPEPLGRHPAAGVPLPPVQERPPG